MFQWNEEGRDGSRDLERRQPDLRSTRNRLAEADAKTELYIFEVLRIQDVLVVYFVASNKLFEVETKSSGDFVVSLVE